MMLAQNNRFKTTYLHLSRILNFVEYTLSETYMHINIHVKNAVSALSVWLHTFAYVLADQIIHLSSTFIIIWLSNKITKVSISINQPYQDKVKSMDRIKIITRLRRSAHILE